jgi:hypothetical protein
MYLAAELRSRRAFFSLPNFFSFPAQRLFLFIPHDTFAIAHD